MTKPKRHLDLRGKRERTNAAKAANQREAEIAKAYLNAGPSIGNLARAAYHWYNSVPTLGGQDESGNIIIKGEPPAVGIKNFGKVLKVATLAGEMERGLSKVKNASKVARAYTNQNWSNFLAAKNGDAYYRMSKTAETGKRAADENFFVSHTTPWEEFSGLGTDTEIGVNHLYEFPTKTFGRLEATTDKGLKTGKDVTEVGKSHLLYGNTASGKRGPVRIVNDNTAKVLDIDSHVIGNVERPLKANGMYDKTPFYEDIYQGNQTVVKGSQLNDAVKNTDYKVYSKTPFGIQTTIHLGVKPPKLRAGGSIHIAPSKRGTFTAAATKHGMGVQEFAARVLRNKENYSPSLIKKANFARNASKWNH